MTTGVGGITGNPGLIKVTSTIMSRAGDDICRQAEALDLIAGGVSDGWSGDAARNAGGSARKAVPPLRLLGTRYQSASGVLARYAAELEAAQSAALKASTELEAAQADKVSADRAVAEQKQYESLHRASPDDYPPYSGTDHRVEQSSASVAVRSAQAAVLAAKDAAQEAAKRCAKGLADCVDDGLADHGSDWALGKLDQIGNDLDSLEEWAKVLDEIALWTGLFALLPIPGVNVVLAGISVAASGVHLGIKTVQISRGDVSTFDYAVSAAFAVLPKGAGKLVKFSKVGERAFGTVVEGLSATKHVIEEDAPRDYGSVIDVGAPPTYGADGRKLDDESREPG